MKDIQQAINDILKKESKQPEQVLNLTLDSVCKSTHITGLDAFVNLKSLSLCGLGLTTLEGFPRLSKLVRLNLSDNRITGAGLTNLRTLELANNRIATVEELAPLKELKALQCLDVDQCPLSKKQDYSSKVFAMLDELKYLDSVDKEGRERDGEDEEEDFEEEDAGEEEYDDGGGEEEFEDEEGGEFEEGEKEYAVLVVCRGVTPYRYGFCFRGPDAVGEDEEGDYQEEGEGDDEEGEEEDEGAAEAPPSGGTKRKREEEEGEEEDEE
ncbi:hypothetical protein VOLCADRAFT_92020 [Volvox carteri f. nagariensis]|uniref:U2A'/phosphoprotein 32 family A C-terminal domain-containing protein n=1 Tax=Volvox carteri f. nagariensis TaxID=3068 RepID=D8TYW4_VOLCA|nr:uncharacterized protein VOLCADRAFT_92020 [Volvox carteri f. nagariensis]EFJ47384.1 hypothetical protein VOLCADRAFT_92020 [Volvox carteri f. nagariensis]|eukprot:XP_002951573.1 hypothetical protein VOLCADRAFT_92020 [Volvox carteri f. nagariensis]